MSGDRSRHELCRNPFVKTPRFLAPGESTSPENPAASGLAGWRIGTLTYTSGGLVLLFFWLLGGDFAWSLKERSVPAVVQLLFKNFGASDLISGLMLGTLPSLVVVVIGPLISYRSDRHRSRHGRRIPYLVWTTPVAVVAMLGLALSPAMAGWVHSEAGSRSVGLNQTIVLLLGVFWTLFELATVAANAVFGALINDVVPRPLLGRFYGLFRALSLIAGMIFNYWLLGPSETHYAAIFAGLGLLYGVGFMVMCLKVKEGEYPADPDLAPAAGQGFMAAIKTYFTECFSNAYYRWVFMAFMLSNLAFYSINLFNLYLAKSLQMEMTVYGKLVALTYLISLMLSYFLGILADRYHPLRVGIVFLILYAILALAGGIFATSAPVFSVILVLHGVLNGAFNTATASLGQRLYPHAKFAQFASAGLMLLSVSQVLVAPLVGRLLDATGHAYRYTYYLGFVLAGFAVLASFVVCRHIVRLGGFENYAAPGGSV